MQFIDISELFASYNSCFMREPCVQIGTMSLKALRNWGEYIGLVRELHFVGDLSWRPEVRVGWRSCPDRERAIIECCAILQHVITFSTTNELAEVKADRPDLIKFSRAQACNGL